MSKLGGGEKCAKCNKTVYANEKAIAAGKNWHQACLKCPDCNKRLDATILTERDGQVFCKACYGKRFGPKGFGFGTSIHTEGEPPADRKEDEVVKSDAAERAAAKPNLGAVGGASNPNYCSGCGNAVNPGSKFCPGCGNKLG